MRSPRRITSSPARAPYAIPVTAVAGALLTVGFALPTAAWAQPLPSAVLLRTHAGAGIDDGTARGFDRVLRQRLDGLGVVAIDGSVELDLEDVQLALGCIGESEACLRGVAEQAGATILVFSSIEAAGSSRAVSVMRFDTRDGTLRRAVRTATTEAEVLEMAEPIARELWDLPSVVEDDVEDEPAPVTPRPPPGLSPWPLVLLGIGGAALIGGAIAMGLGASDQATYAAARRPTSLEEANATSAIFDRAQSEQVAGVVLLVGGGVLATAGVSWVLAAGREDGSSPLAIVPLVSPDGGGVLVAGSFSGGSL